MSSDESSLEQLAGRAEAADQARRWDEAVELWRAVLAHPDVEDEFFVEDILDEIHQLLRHLRRYDDAIAAKREAIAAGFESNPDPEADIAEILLQAGRREEADALYAELRRRDPDDLWLYDSAGYAYAGVDDHEAVRWCLDGIEMANTAGDPDDVAGNLLALGNELWEALAEDADQALIDRVEAVLLSGTAAPEVQTRPAMQLAVAWFPAPEWRIALERWPDLTDDLPADHSGYSHRIEAKLKSLSKATPGQTWSVAPLTVDGLDETAGELAGTAEARSEVALDIHRQGRSISWPPRRNDRCWCGSGRKYKQCCGPEPPAGDWETTWRDGPGP